MKPRILELRKNILEENDFLASKLRDDFSKNKVFVVNVVSSPGSGKTELLTKLMSFLIEKNFKVSAVVGDLATDNDAQRMKNSGAEVYQINTHGNCHLEAIVIKESLDHISWKTSDFLFIENVGNLVCPASYDLGENIRIVLMSVTEGEDKPLKYPTMFNSSDICIISKMDLAMAVEFDEKLAIQNIRKVCPSCKIYKTSAKVGTGVDTFGEKLINLAENVS